jgi:phosphoribosylglycinamide formyltransferase-1
VHFVTAELDGGPVIAQVTLDVQSGDTEQALADRLLPLEHRLLTAVVGLIARGRLRLDTTGILLDGVPLPRPLRLVDSGLVTA